MLSNPLFRYASYTFGILSISTIFTSIHKFNQLYNDLDNEYKNLVEKELDQSVIIYHPEFGKLEKPK